MPRPRRTSRSAGSSRRTSAPCDGRSGSAGASRGPAPSASTWKKQLPGSDSYRSFTPIGLRKSLDAPSGSVRGQTTITERRRRMGAMRWSCALRSAVALAARPSTAMTRARRRGTIPPAIVEGLPTPVLRVHLRRTGSGCTTWRGICLNLERAVARQRIVQLIHSHRFTEKPRRTLRVRLNGAGTGTGSSTTPPRPAQIPGARRRARTGSYGAAAGATTPTAAALRIATTSRPAPRAATLASASCAPRHSVCAKAEGQRNRSWPSKRRRPRLGRARRGFRFWGCNLWSNQGNPFIQSDLTPKNSFSLLSAPVSGMRRG